MRIATASVRTGFAMTGFLQGVRYGSGGRTGSSAPTERVECLRRAGDRKGRPYGSVTRGAVKRADVGIGPYGEVIDGAGCGRGRTPPLRTAGSCPPRPDNATPCRAGPVYPAVGAGKLDSGRCRHRPLRKRILWCVGEGLSCPPLCRPIPGHCRARQSGHFLETGSLPPPPAALRRFPRPRATARVAPTEGYKRCGGVKNPPVTASPCQPPLGKEPRGRGRRIATTSLRTGLAMTGLCKECGGWWAAGHMGATLRRLMV